MASAIKTGDCIEYTIGRPSLEISELRPAVGCVPTNVTAPPPGSRPSRTERTRGTGPATGSQAAEIRRQASSIASDTQREFDEVAGCRDLYSAECKYSPAPYYTLAYDLKRIAGFVQDLRPGDLPGETSRVVAAAELLTNIDAQCDSHRIANPDVAECARLNGEFWAQHDQVRSDARALGSRL